MLYLQTSRINFIQAVLVLLYGILLMILGCRMQEEQMWYMKIGMAISCIET